ncbi:MAG TPA: FHA domain-containing protein [Ktedonobacterales bacterium]
MATADFPAWYSAGIFGGIGCALLSAIAIATWTLWRRRGGAGQLTGALLVCVTACVLDIGSLLWIEYRLNIYGPTLSAGEVGGALASTALVGWAAPLATLCWYVLLARPATTPARAARPGAITPASLDDPSRTQSVNANGEPWGLLTPVDVPASASDSSPSRPIALTTRLTLIGREMDNDIVLDDDRVSRRHAELRWDRGRVELADYGSLNGTLINQQAARGWLILRDGDIIDLGKRRYRFTILQAGTGAADSAADSDDSESVETRKTPNAPHAASPERPLLQLTLVQGAGAHGETWPLSRPVMSIGRDASCDITLADISISRMHAHITRQPAGYFIADLQSSNGVRLNGQLLVGPAQFFAGDVIALGDCLLRCEEVEAPPTSPDADAADALDVTAKRSAPVAMQSLHAASRQPTGAPSFHMRIARQWATGNASRPRLAPPRLTPSPPERENPSL